jgi:CheY-like chemotaxis protein
VSVEEFSNSAKAFTNSPLGIIALFIVLVYGFASLVVTFGENISSQIAPLIYFMVFFPVIVFFGFLWLVAKHHKKLYGPSDFRDEENFIKTQLSSAVSLAAAVSRQTDEPVDQMQSQLDEIVDLVSRTAKPVTNERWKNRILWVDNHPENNVYERRALEQQGLQISIALSTDQALEVLGRDRFAAIISDMGRKEGPEEGYVLLDELRKSGNQTPFIIYAGSNLPEHKQMAKERGALGSTNRAQELFQLVMSAVKGVP